MSYMSDFQKRLLAIGFKLPKFGADGTYGLETHVAVMNALLELEKLRIQVGGKADVPSIKSEPIPEPEPDEDKEPNWVTIAQKYKGVHEVRGGENPTIIKFHACTTLKATEDEVAWCSSFMCFVMEQAGYISTKSAAARSWLTWGKQCDIQYGAIAVLSRTGGNHVGLIVDWDEDSICLLGGNQGDSVCEAWFSQDVLMDCRWPA